MQDRESEPAGSERTGERVTRACVDDVAATGDDARLRSAEELVARERDGCGARLERLTRRGLASHPFGRTALQPRARNVEQARADVDDDRRVQRRELGHLGSLGEPFDAVVRRVHFQHECHIGVAARERSCVVGESSSVRRPDIDEASARLRHHLRHAEPSADLDRFPARDEDITTSSQGREHEKHGGGAVVHDHRRLGATRASDQRRCMRVA